MRQAKYIQIAEAFRRRLHNGDYAFSTLPGAQRLASEMGVSYLTARQAVKKLIDDGVLRRQPSGRLEAFQNSNTEHRNLNIAVIIPGILSPTWANALQKTALNYKCTVRTISYSHDDDPVVFEALDGNFDLIFINFVRNDELFINKLLQYKDKVVTLFHDFTSLGLRCVDGPAPESISELMNYLHELGHRNIDVFNTQPFDRTIKDRIRAWQNSKTKIGFNGQLHNYPVNSFESAVMQAYIKFNELLENGEFKSTAVFCTTVEIAGAVSRACYEKGLKVPDDISICSFGQPEAARMFIPSITVIDRPSPEPELKAIFEQFLKISDEPDKLLFRTQSKSIMIGESTSKPNKKA